MSEKDFIKRLTETVNNTLSEKRARHTLSVARQAVKYAGLYGLDPVRCETAALLHDIMKEHSVAEMTELMSAAGEPPTQEQLECEPVLHAPASALYAERELGVTDSGILDAIRYHSTGRAGMSELEKVLYLADMTGEERSYEGVEEIRRLAEKDLDEAMLFALRRNIEYMLGRKKHIDETSIEAYNWFLKRMGDK